MIGIIFDMDGVIYRGKEPIEGANEVIKFLKANKIPFIFLTNNSTRNARMYKEKLQKMGIDVEEEQIITSGYATAKYLSRNFERGNVFVIGGEGLLEEIKSIGWPVISVENAKERWREIKYVVVGLDPKLTYEKLKYGCLAIRNGALFIGTNPDTTYPSEEGILPGAGSIIAALKAATEREPLIIGKPNKPVFEVVKEKLNADEIWIVGDRLDTDIEFAKRINAKGIMVLTGVNTLEDIEKSKVKPDIVMPSIKELIKYLEVYLEECQRVNEHSHASGASKDL
ncbi:sugar-catabolism phosphotransferase [Thermococcus litoralis DSM 5473]|uniref:Sugar-catabolism phosphotransferase n=1 Tax=Thermococcus litoralis (strain ATCC 51850 / DSM 5473 / JCM 8560 / NS-C) TaxID=523849 RepID=H3ZRA5_THELN|nr:HAD-IIA family hydrolase [Thermococcus litoralis]EHR77574.1 sugar-catabolism phosphotransferase [Thermococcus litoralis DSM 5473]